MTEGLDRRAKFVDCLHPKYLPLYLKLCEVLPARWQPISGYRSIQEQNTLHTIGRSRPGVDVSPERPLGRTVTNARGGFSAHNWGCATDWVLFKKGQPVWTHGEWHEYAAAVKKVGLVWGGDWDGDGQKDREDWDLPHNQLALSVPYRNIGEIYKELGLPSALARLEKHIK